MNLLRAALAGTLACLLAHYVASFWMSGRSARTPFSYIPNRALSSAPRLTPGRSSAQPPSVTPGDSEEVDLETVACSSHELHWTHLLKDLEQNPNARFRELLDQDFLLDTNHDGYAGIITFMLEIFKNNIHVINDAIVPGANLIFPILKKVTKSKLNFLIIFYNRSYDFRGYSLTFPN